MPYKPAVLGKRSAIITGIIRGFLHFLQSIDEIISEIDHDRFHALSSVLIALPFDAINNLSD
jgi:hypothetical protein